MPSLFCKTCQVRQTKGKPNRQVVVCKRLGSHLTDEELSTVIERQIESIPSLERQTNLKSKPDQKDASPTRIEQDIGSARTNVAFGEKSASASYPIQDAVRKLVEQEYRHGVRKVTSSFLQSEFSPSESTHSRSHSSRSFATDCKNKCDLEQPGKLTNTFTSRNHPSKRKLVTHYTKFGHAASTKHTKFGDETLLGLCRPQPAPHTRLAMETYREQLEDMLKELNRSDLLPCLNRTRPLFKDLIEDFYMKRKPTTEVLPTRVLRSATKRQQPPRRLSSRLKEAKLRPVTCEVKMRVRIQYKSHRHLLSGIQSIKNSREEQQMDKFFQATSVMRGRDTGCVVCNISFSDITYLGAFWRDYSNGTLQEALRGVFLTEMMRQTAGNEELDLLVSVDETDFLNGQKLLVKNLETGSGSGSTGFSVRGQIGVPTTARIEQNLIE